MSADKEEVRDRGKHGISYVSKVSDPNPKRSTEYEALLTLYHEDLKTLDVVSMLKCMAVLE